MAERKVQAAKNGMFSVSSRGPKVELHLGKNDPAKFHVIEKDMPEKLPSEWNGVKISWFTCFGVRHRRDDGGDGDFADVEYSVQLDELPKGKRLFAYYGGQVHELSFTSTDGKTKVNLAVGDPPLGWGP
jgi:hypothetical protein